MRFKSTLIPTLLLACSAAADPFLKHQKSRILERSTSTNPTFTYNMAGVSLTGTTFSSITGTFVTPASVTGQDGTALSVYVSLSCENYVLLAGVQYTVSKDGVDHYASLLWPPDYNPTTESIRISARDAIELHVKGSSQEGGSLTVKNINTGETRSQKYEAYLVDCVTHTANWVIQNVTENALPNFGSVSIAADFKADGQTELKKGTRLDIQGLTETSVSGDTITIQYL